MEVLLVDDNDEVRDAVAYFFREEGHDVLALANGAEAWEYISGGYIPDIIITDMAMPKMDGSELLKRVREKFPRLPVILASGLGRWTKDEPFDMIFQKPVDIAALVKASEALAGGGK